MKDMCISLYSVYDRTPVRPSPKFILYDLLKERTGFDSINISHKELPTFREHVKFISSVPYDVWFIIYAEIEGFDRQVGACYLTRKDEIGIFILQRYQSHGIGTMAVRMLMDLTERTTYYANVNPKNLASQLLFTHKLGFTPYKVIPGVQDTYKLEW